MSSDLNTLLSGWDDEAGWLSTGNLGQDFVVAQTPGSPTIMDTAGNTGSFVGGTWTPTPNTTNVSWMSQIPKGLQDVLKGLTSPAGIAGLGGAALGYLDRPEPSGGGTTMAYPGAQQITRKIVQGPYGPLAEYSGFGMPDYGTQAPTGPGAGQSVQSKIDQYKTLQGYGLAPEAIRRIAEAIYGPQTDRDWAELTRLVGGSGGISGTGGGTQTTTPATTTTPAMQDAAAKKEFLVNSYNSLLKSGMSPEAIRKRLTEVGGPITDDVWNEVVGSAGASSATTTPAAAPAADGTQKTGFIQKFVDYLPQLTPEEKAGFYKYLLNQGNSDLYLRKLVETNTGPVTNSDWAYLQDLARKLPQDFMGGISTEKFQLGTLKKAIADWQKGGKAQGGIIQGYARGGAVQMEDGGFVMTKRAVDGAGGPRGIQQLVPGARMIGGPADPTGKRDLTPAVINGPRGQTPAKVSRGEAYVPPGHDTKKLYALMRSLERNA